MRVLYETHLHTTLCKHATGDLDDYAAMAERRGLRGIIVTCHCPMPEGFSPGIRMQESEWAVYVQMVRETAQRWEGKVDVRLGLESEYFPGMEDWITELHQRETLDYALGSVHCHMREYRKKFEHLSDLEFQRTYFRHLAESAETGLYDSLSHPDLVKNEFPDTWNVNRLLQDIRESLDRIAETGVAMELNTSGINKSIKEMNPGVEILREMQARGIPVTVGADAHHPARVADGYETALKQLLSIGYDEVNYFLERKRHSVQISDALTTLKPVPAYNG